MIASEKGYIDMVKLLLQEKVVHNINLKNKIGGETALIYASKKGHKDIVELLLDKGANLDIRDIKSYNALMYARQNNYEEIIKLIEDAKKTKPSSEINTPVGDWMSGLFNLKTPNIPPIPSKEDKLIDAKIIPSIGKCAFADCKSLTSINIPESKKDGRKKKSIKKKKKSIKKKSIKKK